MFRAPSAVLRFRAPSARLMRCNSETWQHFCLISLCLALSRNISQYLGISRLFGQKNTPAQPRYAAEIPACSLYVPYGEGANMAVREASRMRGTVDTPAAFRPPPDYPERRPDRFRPRRTTTARGQTRAPKRSAIPLSRRRPAAPALPAEAPRAQEPHHEHEPRLRARRRRHAERALPALPRGQGAGRARAHHVRRLVQRPRPSPRGSCRRSTSTTSGSSSTSGGSPAASTPAARA